MLKLVKPLIINKIWGTEKWLFSSLQGQETCFENGDKTTNGPLIKIITTNKPLSIQVHPDNKWAQKLEKLPNGKHESWYILAVKKNAQLILGMKNYDPNYIINNVHTHNFLSNLNVYKPKVGDFYDIPAGYVHGLGAHLTVLEVQQSSDITYRYYDYQRLEKGKLRKLDIDKAIKCQKKLTHHLQPISTNPLTYKNKFFTQKFCNKKSWAPQNSIVVDLKTQKTYYVTKNIEVDFTKFVIIEW